MKEKILKIGQSFSQAAVQPIMFLAVMGTTLALAVIMQLNFMPTGVIFVGKILKSMMDGMINNLSIIFCVGLATAFAKKKKVDAAILSLISYLIFLAANNSWLSTMGMLAEEGAMGLFGTGQNIVLGFQVVDMNVFLGLMIGCITGYIHNKFSDTKFPEIISIYGGSRFSFILMIPITLILAIVLSYIWPVVNDGISSISTFIKSSDSIGVFLYSFGNRFLIPTGLHHLLWMPFNFTGFGGSAEISGQVVQGAANIFYAEMGNATTLTNIDNSIRFATFGFAKIFGSVGISLAFIKTAKPKYKKAVKGMIIPTAFVAFAAGITEPLDFSFLFISPLLWFIHSIVTGISEVLLWVLGSRTYSLYGAIDTFICNSVIDISLTKAYIFIILGIIMTAVWYFVFKFLIEKFDIKTPGRDDSFGDEIESEEKSKIDLNENDIKNAQIIIEGLGGKENISSVNNCFTRLRVDVKEVDKVNKEIIKKSKQKGVIINGNNVQIVIGMGVENTKENVKKLLK